MIRDRSGRLSTLCSSRKEINPSQKNKLYNKMHKMTFQLPLLLKMFQKLKAQPPPSVQAPVLALKMMMMLLLLLLVLRALGLVVTLSSFLVSLMPKGEI
jgi:hypothetical protein